MTETTGERADPLEALTKHRELFLGTVEGLTDEQARLTPTASELSLGGLVKHVASTVEEWNRFVVEGPGSQPAIDWESVDWSDPPQALLDYQDQFRLGPDERLAGVLARFRAAAHETDRLVADADLDARQPLPEAPWFEQGASWSGRRVLVHLVAEISQHAGHADILRESIDGRKSMG